jgi:hypothetical protein
LPAPWAEVAAFPGLVPPELFAYRLTAMREDRFVLTMFVAADLHWVLQHDKGYRVYLHCVEGLLPEADGSALIEIRAAQLAEQADVARGTVCNLLLDAERQGWFTPVDGSTTLRRWSAAQMRAARRVGARLLGCFGHQQAART